MVRREPASPWARWTLDRLLTRWCAEVYLTGAVIWLLCMLAVTQSPESLNPVKGALIGAALSSALLGHLVNCLLPLRRVLPGRGVLASLVRRDRLLAAFALCGPPAWLMAVVALVVGGGPARAKERLEVAFLAPLRNPELRRLYGKSLRGGLLLYGPPGCGKTFVARAVAGQMGASFISAALSDVLDAYVGQSEQNVHTLFRLARSHAPAVLFLDEIDAIGHKRTHTAFSSLRNVVNQLLTELDGIGSDNDGVYVLAATNAPWDVDPALRRPGRLDRSIAVLPPDEPARAAILHHHLRARPWFDVARNVVTYADASGEYAELAAYMKRHSLL